jgi:hypothetical protein
VICYGVGVNATATNRSAADADAGGALSRRSGVCPVLLPSPSVQALQVEFNLTTPSVAIMPDGGTGLIMASGGARMRALP